MAVENITLALASLKEYIERFLNAAGWKGFFSIYMAGDPALFSRTLVLEASDRRKEIEIPVIVINTGNIRNEKQELGNSIGKDLITLSVITIARDEVQLNELSNLIRREIDGLTFDIYDYTNNSEKVSTGIIENPVSTDVSDVNSDNVADRFNVITNCTLELDAASFI